MNIRFNNDAYDESTGDDRNLYIDAVEIYRNDELISVVEGEDFESAMGFSQTVYDDGNAMGAVEYSNVEGVWLPSAWNMWGEGYVAFRINITGEANYRFRIIAWGSDYRDGIAANMTATVGAIELSSDTAGARSLRSQIQHLHKLMLGENLSSTDPEIEAVYQLLVETWQERKTHTDNVRAWTSPSEECLFPRQIDQDEWITLGADPEHMLYAWTSVMHYYLTHFDYLHE